MGAFQDITGMRFNMLTAVKRVANQKTRTMWLFKCDCGNEKEMSVLNVKFGTAVGCGCLRVLHGKADTRAYQSWRGMRGRCLDKKNKEWKNYGGRGIDICKDWMLFENFFKDMGERPNGLTLDRINNNKGYSKKNCRWADIITQANNKRKRKRKNVK